MSSNPIRPTSTWQRGSFQAHRYKDRPLPDLPGWAPMLSLLHPGPDCYADMVDFIGFHLFPLSGKGGPAFMPP